MRRGSSISKVGVLMAGVLWAMLTPAQESAPKPVPEHKKLQVLVGSWSLEGDVKPNPMGPGGKMSENETCEWMDGNFFLICHVDFKSANSGNGTAISIFGYSQAEKAYSYREFNSWGEFEDSRGTIEGDSWVWTSDEKMGSTIMKGRFTMKFASPASYTFVYEMSPDGAKWMTVVEGRATKK